jgi:hypothetical protein
MQHAMRMCHIVICGLPAYIFPHYLINGTIFKKKVMENQMRILIASTTFERSTFNSKKNSTRYHKKYWYESKVPVLLPCLNET